jgi:transposase-like protein
MQKRKWSPEELEAVRAGVADGQSVATLAQHWGRSVGAIESKLWQIEQRERRQRQDAVAPLVPRSGQSWAQEEEDALVSAFSEGARIEDLVRSHQRSTAAVMSKLVALGLVYDEGGTYYRKIRIIHWHEFVDIDERVYRAGNADEQS